MTRSGFLLLLLTAALAGCASEPAPPASSSDQVSDLKERVRELYRQARESGQQVPKDALEWAQAGSAPYRRLGVQDRGPAAGRAPESRQARLNELGMLRRWEAFWMEPAGNGMRVYLKRRSKSWLEKDPPIGVAAPLAIQRRGCGIVESRSGEDGFLDAGNGFGGAVDGNATREIPRQTMKVFKEIQQWQDSGSVWAACWRVWR